MTTTENILKIENKAKPFKSMNSIHYVYRENPQVIYEVSQMIPIIIINIIYRTESFSMVFNELSVKMCEDKLQGISFLFDLHFFFNL